MWSHVGLMISWLDYIYRGLGLVLFSWARLFTLTVSLSTQLYKWVPVNWSYGVTLWWTSTPSRGNKCRNTHNWLMLHRVKLSVWRYGYLCMIQAKQTFFNKIYCCLLFISGKLMVQITLCSVNLYSSSYRW